MAIHIRKAAGALIHGFAFGGLLFSAWRRSGAYPLALAPDPARGLLYPCHPHSAAWYETAFTIVKSWDFAVFIVIALIGATIHWEAPRGSKMRPQWPYNAPDTLALVIGMGLGAVFAIFAEPSAIDWAMAHGVRPPAISCSPFFTG